MEALTYQIAIIAGVLAACFAGPAAAVFFLLRRKKKARQSRRSPIGISLLRGPGHSLRQEIETATNDLTWDVVLLMVVPLMALTLFLAQSVLGPARLEHLGLLYGLCATGFIGYMLRKLVKAGVHLDHLKAGYDAELAVGQELDQLMRQGAATFHDVPGERFNIDHVVVAAEGVFAVETKGFTKPNQGRGKADATATFDGNSLKFPTWTTKDPIEQAERQASWLAGWLGRATGSPVTVQPVVALPGWFVERTGRGRVRVFSGRELHGLLKARGASALSQAQAQQITHQLDQRCRTVAPLYAEEQRAN